MKKFFDIDSKLDDIKAVAYYKFKIRGIGIGDGHVGLHRIPKSYSEYFEIEKEIKKQKDVVEVCLTRIEIIGNN